MQDKNVITSRERVNRNFSKLPYVNGASRSTWFDKRRYGNF